MNPSVASKTISQTHQRRVSEEQVVEDASSSSATRGSVTSADDKDGVRAKSKQVEKEVGFVATETMNGERYPSFGQHLGSSVPGNQQSHMHDKRSLPTTPVMHGRHDYSLDRFVQEIDPREKARLGDLKTFVNLPGQQVRNKTEKCIKGCGATREERVKQNGDRHHAEDVDGTKEDVAA